MHIVKTFKGASSVARYLHSGGRRNKLWKLRWKPVSSSTEKDLSEWIKKKPLLEDEFRAFFAGRQVYGTGQRGRKWHSPAGGVWISAAIPSSSNIKSPELLGLSLAVSLSQRLENYSIPVRIKWPNDLMVNQRKLVGFLPKLISRGNSIRYFRFGIGLNVFNKSPIEGISIQEIIRSSSAGLDFWSAEVLFALEDCIELLSSPEVLLLEARNRLWAENLSLENENSLWDIDGFLSDGALKIKQGSRNKILRRWS